MFEHTEREKVHRLVRSLTRYAWVNPDKSEYRPTVDINDVQFGIDKIPAADVVEVRHGKWIGEPSVTISANKGRTIRSTIYKCSLCNKTNGRIKKLYCPNCGARMGGDTE